MLNPSITFKPQNLHVVAFHNNIEVFCSSLTSQYHDNASRFVQLLSKKHPADYLETDDFIPLLQVKTNFHGYSIYDRIDVKFSNNTVNFAPFVCLNEQLNHL